MKHYDLLLNMHQAFFDAYYWWEFPDYDYKVFSDDTVGLYMACGEL